MTCIDLFLELWAAANLVGVAHFGLVALFGRGS
jgi:hypothetical protein